MHWIYADEALAGFQIDSLEIEQSAIAFAVVDDFSDSLHQEESERAESMGERHIRTYSSGRHCVRMVQEDLRIAQDAIHWQDRMPVWPEGVGSITHSDLVAAASLALPGSGVTGIGIDIEESERLGQELWHKVFTPNELTKMRTEDAVICFSAKEAGYKAIYPTGLEFIGFQEAEIELDQAKQEFAIRYLGDHKPNKALEQGRGYYQFHHGHVFTLFVI